LTRLLLQRTLATCPTLGEFQTKHMTRLRDWMVISLTATIALNCVEVQATPKALGKDLTPETVTDGDRVVSKQLTVESLEADPVPPQSSAADLASPEMESRQAQASQEPNAPNVSDFLQPSGATPIAPDEPAPSYLDPHPNLLRFPTRTEEVEIAGTQPISLNQALELAVRNNLDLQQSRVNLERSLASLRETQAELFPGVNLSSNLTWSDSANARISIRRQEDTLGERSPIQTDPTSITWNTELRVNYTLFDFGGRSARIAAAEAQVRTTELEIERQLEQVRLQVSEAYYDIQDADMSVQINRSAVENAQQSLEDAQALESAGVGTRFDVLRAEVQLANDQQALNEALASQRVARRRLARVLNVPQSVDLAAADPVDLAGVWELDLEQTIILALRNRAELQQQLVDRDIAQEQQRAVRSQALPQFSLSWSIAISLKNNNGRCDRRRSPNFLYLAQPTSLTPPAMMWAVSRRAIQRESRCNGVSLMVALGRLRFANSNSKKSRRKFGLRMRVIRCASKLRSLTINLTLVWKMSVELQWPWS